jgi:hypothetical protein
MHKYMMDKTGYCYPTTPLLARNPDMRPWNGPVDAHGFAVEREAPAPKWAGKTVVCVASGPSLTAEDCQKVKQAGLPTIAVNTSWERAPFADIVFAQDAAWWRHHGERVPAHAERWTGCPPAVEEFPDLNLLVQRSRANNSGALAIELAHQLGAQRILLLGYDCSIDNGVHWHGQHEKTDNPDNTAVRRWHGEFASVAQVVDCEVLNCSRTTALECFTRAELTAVLPKRTPRKITAAR